MVEDKSSGDLDVQLEWPQGDEPSLDVGREVKGALVRRARRQSRALGTAAVPEAAPGVKALSDKVDGLARAVSQLDAQVTEQGARIEQARDEASWDSGRILARLDVLRGATQDLRRVRDHVDALVERRLKTEAQLQAELRGLAVEVRRLRSDREGEGVSLNPAAIEDIARAVASGLSAVPRTAAAKARQTQTGKRTAKRSSRPAGEGAARKTAKKSTTAKRGGERTRER